MAKLKTEITTICGCGKLGTYVLNMNTQQEVYSCNTYKRCPSREELEEEILELIISLKNSEELVGELRKTLLNAGKGFEMALLKLREERTGNT